jgi:hypothetical protein
MTEEVLLQSTFWRREYMAELVTEESRAALPQWNEELHKLVVGDWQRPTYWDGYQAHDPGITGDPHASLFAFHDFASNTVTIEDELELRSAAYTTRQWADEVKKRETHLYGATSWNGTLIGAKDWAREFGDLPEYAQSVIHHSAPRQPYLRVGDDAQGICQDMTVDHGLGMFPTPKHDKALEMSNLNHALSTGKIRIHSRCVRLIEQCYSTVWNKARTQWERTDKDHGDLIDDLQYMHRNIRWHRDCRPPPKGDVFALPKHMQPTTTKGLDALKGAFGQRR